MGKPERTSRDSGGRRDANRPASSENAGLRRALRTPLLWVGLLACVVAGGVLVYVLYSRAPDPAAPAPGPTTTTAGGGAVSGTEAVAASQPGDLPVAVQEALRKESFDVIRRLMADFPRSSDAIGLMGLVYERQGNSEEAVHWWLKCLQADPRRADVYYELGLVAFRKGENERAAKLWRTAQKINPNMPGSYGACAMALLEMGDADGAFEALTKEIRLSPNVSEHYKTLGKICLLRKQYEQAVEAYTKALELKPGLSRPHYGLATAYARLGQADKAAQHMAQFRKLRKAEDDASVKRIRSTQKVVHPAKILAEVLTGAGQVYMGHRRAERAEEYWTRAARLDPTNKRCRQHLAMQYITTRRPEKALGFCEQLRKLDPKDATTQVNTGTVLVQLKRYDAAEAALREGIRLAPKRAPGYRMLVQVLLITNRKLPEAEALAQKLVGLAPTAANYKLLGEACQRNGNPSGAAAARQRAAALAPAGAAGRPAPGRPPQRQ